MAEGGVWGWRRGFEREEDGGLEEVHGGGGDGGVVEVFIVRE